jgi:uncharacterized protein (TIGR00255 family)
MTGQGQGQASNSQYSVSVELRAVNSRYLKINLNGIDAFASLAPDLENQIRQQLRRGTLTAQFRIECTDAADDYSLNESVIASYQNQLRAIAGDSAEIDVTALLNLPGVVCENVARNSNTTELASVAKQALHDALQKMSDMRQREGSAMAADLHSNCDQILRIIELIKKHAPKIVEAYATRLEERINQMLSKIDVEIDRKDIIREIGIFADRCDVAEELVRLQCHLEQLHKIVDGETSNGRKLDFLTQELLRETNTIGSKANDAEIAGFVVEIKTIIERIREMVQNVE